jgi:hypothetical protein
MVHGGEECGDVGAAIGIRVGVGLSLTSAPWAGDWSRPELRRLVTDGADYKVTFDEFLYYLRVFFSPPSSIPAYTVRYLWAFNQRKGRVTHMHHMGKLSEKWLPRKVVRVEDFPLCRVAEDVNHIMFTCV